ncbi:MAG: FxsA family protein [Solirubrobacterales bacterium]
MPLVLLFIVFIVVPVVELWLILQVAELLGGGATGGGLTVLLLVGDSILGAWLVRSQGRSVWRRFSGAITAGRIPAREVVDGGFVIVGGVLLVTPGFLSDFLGFLMVIPLTRKLFGRWAFGYFSSRVRLVAPFADTGLQDFARSTRPPRSDPEFDPAENGAPGAVDARPGIEPGDEPDFDFETRQPKR